MGILGPWPGTHVYTSNTPTHCKFYSCAEKGDIHTQEKPSNGILVASIPRIKELFSAWYGFAGRSYVYFSRYNEDKRKKRS